MYYCNIFQQLFKFISRYRFDKMVEKVSGDRYCKSFSAWQQFLTCLYAQITGKDSLREIASGLVTNQSRLYHLGMAAVAKSTLADCIRHLSFTPNDIAPITLLGLFRTFSAKSYNVLSSALFPAVSALIFFRGPAAGDLARLSLVKHNIMVSPGLTSNGEN